MFQRPAPAIDPSIETWAWLIDALADEVRSGAPCEPAELIAALSRRADGPARILVARLAARLRVQRPDTGIDPYLPIMFRDP